MKILAALLVSTAILSSPKAHADESTQVFDLAPAYHSLLVLKQSVSGGCELDRDRSVDFRALFGPGHSSLQSLKLQVSAVAEPGGQNFRNVQLMGLTHDKTTQIKVSFVASRTTTEALINAWVMTPKRRIFPVTEEALCAGGSLGYHQISGYSAQIL